MQCYTIFFIAVNALHVSGSFSAHHQELKLYMQHLVLVVWVSWQSQLTHASGSSKQAWHIPDAVCTVWAPDDGRKTAWNM
jgi:hypothetical protein